MYFRSPEGFTTFVQSNVLIGSSQKTNRPFLSTERRKNTHGARARSLARFFAETKQRNFKFHSITNAIESYCQLNFLRPGYFLYETFLMNHSYSHEDTLKLVLGSKISQED